MKRNTPNILILSGLCLILFGQGCQSQTPPVDDAENTKMQEENVEMPSEPNSNLKPREQQAESKEQEGDSPVMGLYESFTQDAFDTYRKEGRPIVLYFYANWCPTCAAERPVFKRVIEESDFNIVALQVNYKDSDTDDIEEALAKTYGIFLQHTYVYLNRNGEELTRTIGTQGEKALRNQIDQLK